MNRARQPHPSDVGRRLRMVAGHALLAFALASLAVGLVLALLASAGWLGPAGLPW